MINIVFLDRTGLPPHGEIPRPTFPHTWTNYDITKPHEVLERAKEAEIIVTSKVILNREILSQLPKLKLIAITATGTNNVDLIAAKELGITVKNVADYSFVTVPEHVIGLIFALKHSLMNWYLDQKQAKWGECEQFCYFDHPLKDVRGSTLGIVGKGCIGREVGRLAENLGMKVIYAERKNAEKIREGYLPFESVLKEADILSLHCPLTAETENLINADTLALMKSTAFIINTGRGPLLDEKAVVEALKDQKLGGLAIDVLRKEPPEKDNLLLKAGVELPNVILTPHIAWASDSAVDILVKKVHQNIEEFVKELA